METKEHLYFRSQKVTISGVLSYIIRSNSLNTYIISNSFNKPNTGDPLKKKKLVGALEEKAVETERKKNRRDKMAGALEDKMAGALEEKEEKGEDKGERNSEKKARRRRGEKDGNQKKKKKKKRKRKKRRE